MSDVLGITSLKQFQYRTHHKWCSRPYLILLRTSHGVNLCMLAVRLIKTWVVEQSFNRQCVCLICVAGITVGWCGSGPGQGHADTGKVSEPICHIYGWTVSRLCVGLPKEMCCLWLQTGVSVSETDGWTDREWKHFDSGHGHANGQNKPVFSCGLRWRSSPQVTDSNVETGNYKNLIWFWQHKIRIVTSRYCLWIGHGLFLFLAPHFF